MRKIIKSFLLWFGLDEDGADILSWTVVIVLLLVMTVQFIFGISEANKENECKVSSFYDVLVSPAYATGCILNKDRFNIKLN